MYSSNHHTTRLRGKELSKGSRRTRFSGIAFGSLLLACSCSSAQSDADSQKAVDTNGEPDDTILTTTLPPEQEEFHADNDIAMRVRSVAAAINEGAPIDSTDYNFSGVLTDGLGSPLFTDFEGLPGQWEVDVISPREVRIRNIGTGDLIPGSLMEYLTSSINSVSTEEESPDLEMVASYDSGDAQIEVYSYGRATVQVETRPEMLPTGEVGPHLEIILTCDTLTTHVD